ncbi:enoyl-CoA hydratase/isomerase family protein [Desulfitobacterium hafniense]|uniref:enoyl-CoA hydratase/isomerase family protein n=1 Tax=Desulfitobacterium hafniense TaxID=49338 RepID=UPI000371ED8A|nr:enoyl-CoA hydratase/isomerase family protein [Desulfitobacterium hafniense]
MKEYHYFRVASDGPIATMTLCRPEKMNTLGFEAWREIQEIQNKIEDNPEIRVLIINAEGPSFSAGIDLKELKEFDSKSVISNLPKVQRAYTRFQEMNAVVIAAVNGACYGSGFEMITACDIRLASADARFAIPEARFGLAPDMGGTQRLPRLVGPGQAKRLILACEEIDAQEALQMGFIELIEENYEGLQARALKLAQRIVNNPPWAVRFGKKAINAAADSSIAGGLLLEQIQSAFCCGTQDQNEAVAAFFEKRKPVFQDR